MTGGSEHPGAAEAGVSPRHRLAIVDNHALVVDGLAEWVQINAPDFEVVATGIDWSGLMAALGRRPEVVILARVMEPMSLETRVARCLEAGARVVVMSALGTPAARAEAREAGAAAFVLKSRPATELMDAARRALDPARDGMAGDDEHAHGDSVMTEDDLAVIRLYASGHSTLDISLVQGVKFEVVRSSLKRIRRMYEAQGRRVATRDELLRRAAEDGYLTELPAPGGETGPQ